MANVLHAWKPLKPPPSDGYLSHSRWLLKTIEQRLGIPAYMLTEHPGYGFSAMGVAQAPAVRMFNRMLAVMKEAENRG